MKSKEIMKRARLLCSLLLLGAIETGCSMHENSESVSDNYNNKVPKHFTQASHHEIQKMNLKQQLPTHAFHSISFKRIAEANFEDKITKKNNIWPTCPSDIADGYSLHFSDLTLNNPVVHMQTSDLSPYPIASDTSPKDYKNSYFLDKLQSDYEVILDNYNKRHLTLTSSTNTSPVHEIKYNLYNIKNASHDRKQFIFKPKQIKFNHHYKAYKIIHYDKTHELKLTENAKLK